MERMIFAFMVVILLLLPGCPGGGDVTAADNGIVAAGGEESGSTGAAGDGSVNATSGDGGNATGSGGEDWADGNGTTTGDGGNITGDGEAWGDGNETVMGAEGNETLDEGEDGGEGEAGEDYSCTSDKDCMEKGVGNVCMGGICGYAQEPAGVLEIPPEIEEHCYGFLIGAPDEAGVVRMAGGRWIRPHPGPFSWERIEPVNGEFDFYEADEWVAAAAENEVGMLATVWPFAQWDQENCRDSGCMVGSEDVFYGELPDYRCAPCSYYEYRQFLSALVERYDGDGVDDMPGLAIPVKYWEILNEPEMDSAELTFYKGSKAEYVELLKESREAVRDACPDCLIVQGGAAGSDNTMEYWDEIFSLGAGDYFDIGNIHYISYWDAGTFNARDFGELMLEHSIDAPLWVTEAHLEREDEDVENSFYGARGAGAQKIFFTSLKIGGKSGADKYAQGPFYSEIYNELECK